MSPTNSIDPTAPITNIDETHINHYYLNESTDIDSRKAGRITDFNSGKDANDTYNTSESSELLPSPASFKSIGRLNGTNIASFMLLPREESNKSVTPKDNLYLILYIVVPLSALLIIAFIAIVLVWKHYRSKRKTDDSTSSRTPQKHSGPNGDHWSEREVHTPLTFESSDSIKTIKVRTFAPTPDNNLMGDDGTEV